MTHTYLLMVFKVLFTVRPSLLFAWISSDLLDRVKDEGKAKIHLQQF
uniref:Uncharacterized protein n=1 Tax=Triticum urartu TaxID=4572 RepID=A0A8R7US02_TRIUA